MVLHGPTTTDAAGSHHRVKSSEGRRAALTRAVEKTLARKVVGRKPVVNFEEVYGARHTGRRDPEPVHTCDEGGRPRRSVPGQKKRF
jgi:hypothetical protein